MPQPTIWKILRKRLKVKPYRQQLLQKLKATDKISRRTFCSECTFHLSGKVNRHNVGIWETEPPRHEVLEHERDSPKFNVFCAVSKYRMYGPFFFAERTISGFIYLDMLENYLIPQLQDMEGLVFFQQDGAPPYFHTEVRQFLDTTFPEWIGRGGTVAWPPGSPDPSIQI
jgi:hypothetical protein